MKKYFQYIVLGVFILFGAIAVLIFSGALGGEKDPNAIAVNSPVVIWGTISQSAIDLLLSTGKLNTGGEIIYEEKPIGSIERELVEALARGEGPDAIIAPINVILSQADKFEATPYTAIPERKFRDSFIEGAEIFLSPEGITAFPLFVDPIVMYWNRSIFSNASISIPPKNWNEFLLLPSKLTVRDDKGNIVQSLIALGGYRNINNAKEIISALVLQAGDAIVSRGSLDDKIRVVFGKNSAETASAISFYMDFANSAKPTYSWNSALPDSLDYFIGGNLAVYFGLASELSNIQVRNPHLDFDVAMFPQIKDTDTRRTFGNFIAIAVLKNSRNTNRFNVASTLAFGQFPQSYASVVSVSTVRRDILSKQNLDPYKTIFNQSAMVARGGLDVDPVVTDGIFRNMIDSIAIGRASVSQSIGQANDSIENLFK